MGNLVIEFGRNTCSTILTIYRFEENNGTMERWSNGNNVMRKRLVRLIYERNSGGSDLFDGRMRCKTNAKMYATMVVQAGMGAGYIKYSCEAMAG